LDDQKLFVLWLGKQTEAALLRQFGDMFQIPLKCSEVADQWLCERCVSPDAFVWLLSGNPAEPSGGTCGTSAFDHGKGRAGYR